MSNWVMSLASWLTGDFDDSSLSNSAANASAVTNTRQQQQSNDALRHKIAPWEEVPSHWMGLQHQLKQHILDIPQKMVYFDIQIPEEFEISLQVRKTHDMASVVLKEDIKLARKRFELVPRRMSHDEFWRVYFYVVKFIKDCKPGEVPQKLQELYASGKLHDEQKELIDILMEECTSLQDQADKLTETLENFNQLTMTEKMGRDLPPGVEKPTVEEIESLMRNCIEGKKKVSLLATEIYDDTYIHRAQEVNVSFQVLMSQYVIFERLTYQPKKKLKSSSFTPKILGSKRPQEDATVTTESQRKNICLVLPIRFNRRHWRLLYSSREHGISLQTLYRHCGEHSPVLVIVQTTKGTVMGCFCGTSIHMSHKYYGSGETFVFHFNKDSDRFKSYHWTKQNDYFVCSNSSSICFGGGQEGGPALQLDSEFKYGSSHQCMTFNSPPLVRGESEDALADAGDFTVHAVECFAFDLGKSTQL